MIEITKFLIDNNFLVTERTKDALSSIEGNYRIVWSYNVSDKSDPLKKYDPTALFGNDLEHMGSEKGYRIMMTHDDIFEI